MRKIIVTTAMITSSRGYRYYIHFGIHEKTKSLYTSEMVNIVTCYMVKHEDQELIQIPGMFIPDYWGWYSYATNTVDMIYPSYVQLSCCLSIPNAVEMNLGYPIRLRVLNDITGLQSGDTENKSAKVWHALCR